MPQKKLKIGIIGATGYVGQRFVTVTADHPWFELTTLVASSRSAGRPYGESVAGRWKLGAVLPPVAARLPVQALDAMDSWLDTVDFVFCAVDMPKDEIRALEETIARREVPVISNNSAHRQTADVPMLIPEVNPGHSALIDAQRRRLGTSRGFIAVKPNCSIQSYVPALEPLREFGLEQLFTCTYQAISGAGKTFSDWPEMEHNLIPYIGGEEEKSEQEPRKIWGELQGNHIELASKPVISAQCYRVAVQEGHTAAVSVKFSHSPSRQEILDRWANFVTEPQRLNLPSAPKPFLIYRDEESRPQPDLDVLAGDGMAVTIGRLRPDPLLDWKFTCLSHNTLRGAAGGAVLSAELLVSQGYLRTR